MILNRAEKNRKRPEVSGLKRTHYARAHTETTLPVFTRCTCAKTHMCAHAPNLSFRIHLARIIDHECTSDRAARGPSQKSSYLHSPCIVGFRIKRGATGGGRSGGGWVLRHGGVSLRRERGEPSMSHKFIGNAVHEITEDCRLIIGFNETREFIRKERRRLKFKIS